jgi:hypothetical protein
MFVTCVPVYVSPQVYLANSNIITPVIFTIKWEFVTTVGSKTRLIYIIQSILAIQSTINNTIYDRQNNSISPTN